MPVLIGLRVPQMSTRDHHANREKARGKPPSGFGASARTAGPTRQRRRSSLRSLTDHSSLGAAQETAVEGPAEACFRCSPGSASLSVLASWRPCCWSRASATFDVERIRRDICLAERETVAASAAEDVRSRPAGRIGTALRLAALADRGCGRAATPARSFGGYARVSCTTRRFGCHVEERSDSNRVTVPARWIRRNES
jgi:hypothetical protein